MKNFLSRTQAIASVYITVAVLASALLSNAQTNITVTPERHPTESRSGFSPDDSCAYPNLSNVLWCGWDGGGADIFNINESYVNDRFHAFQGPHGEGAYQILSDYYIGLADFDVASNNADYFPDALSGDVCFRSQRGAIRIGYDNNAGSFSSALVVETNAAVSVTSGPLYLTPQGDLLMGSFTNSPPR